jgi:hypothetical protein
VTWITAESGRDEAQSAAMQAIRRPWQPDHLGCRAAARFAEISGSPAIEPGRDGPHDHQETPASQGKLAKSFHNTA